MKKRKIIQEPVSQKKISSYFSTPSFSKLQLKKSSPVKSGLKDDNNDLFDLTKSDNDKDQYVQKISDIPKLLSEGTQIGKAIEKLNLENITRSTDTNNLGLSKTTIHKTALQARDINGEFNCSTNSPSKRIKINTEAIKLNQSDISNSKKENIDINEKSAVLEDQMLPEFNEYFMDNMDFDEFDEIELEEINLDKWQKCKVTDIFINSTKILKVQSISNNKRGSCIISDFWNQVCVEKGSIVSLIAIRNESNEYCISNNGGYLVLWPDNLITGTEIVGSLFCMRKSILQSNYRGIDPGNKSMVIGSLVHELLQICLNNHYYTVQNITSECKAMLSKIDVIKTLYEGNLKSEEALIEMKKYIPHMSEFMNKYVNQGKISSTNNVKVTPKSSWNGIIKNIIDIEENIWSPNFGISGRIDVTVEVTIHNKSKKMIMPLELKTGKHQNSAEHRGQVILYTMIMSLIENKQYSNQVNEGLLLYLKDSAEVQQINANYAEKRDLIILRNQLAYYYNKWKECFKSPDEKVNVELPEPVDHHSACKSCPYLTLCSIYLSKNKKIELSKNHLLMQLNDTAVGHLSSNDIEYFLKWCHLVNLEESSGSELINRKDIWNTLSSEREKRGKCLSNMTILSIKRINDKYEHIFEKYIKENGNILHSQLQPGNYVVVGTDTKYAECAGFITEINDNNISILLNKDLSKRNIKSTIFNIDAYDSSTTTVFNLSNLGMLMDNSEISNDLRRIIVNKVFTPCDDKLPKSILQKGECIFKKLNQIQLRAVLKALTIEKYMLIKGMPGTGKTQTLVALVELFVKLNKSVLITSHTHSAIDNVFLRLRKCNLKMVRLGSNSRIHQDLQMYSETVLTRHCESPLALEKAYNSFEVVGVTCLGSNHPLLSKRSFDVCIVDESTQVLQCSILRPLYAAKKFILVGDPDQLPPIVKSTQARSLGMDESLFTRLDNIGATISLTLQYRMNKTIMNLANSVTYNNQLKCANSKIENGFLTLNNKVVDKYVSQHSWLKCCLANSLKSSVVIVDTGFTNPHCTNLEYFKSVKNLNDLKYSNICEAALILTITISLLEAGVEEDQIGVIAPYRDQVLLLRTVFSNYISTKRAADDDDNFILKLKRIEINTVDQYQGKDKEVIIYSCTNSWKNKIFSDVSKDNHLLEDKRRLTVAITRAKFKLIVIGDVETLKCYSPFNQLFKSAVEENIGDFVSLQKLESDGLFLWKDVLKIIP